MAQAFFKKTFTHREFYNAVVAAARSMRHLIAARQQKTLAPQFVERIMLAVTEVNGCEVCSYAHTKMALEQGMSPDEVSEILSGDIGRIPEDEAVGVVFTQHFADQRGHPSAQSWQRLIDFYGEDRAWGILAAARVMQAANISGIPISAFGRRLKGQPVKQSSLLHEISMLLANFIYVPAGILHGLLTRQSDKAIGGRVRETLID